MLLHLFHHKVPHHKDSDLTTIRKLLLKDNLTVIKTGSKDPKDLHFCKESRINCQRKSQWSITTCWLPDRMILKKEPIPSGTEWTDLLSKLDLVSKLHQFSPFCAKHWHVPSFLAWCKWLTWKWPSHSWLLSLTTSTLGSISWKWL